MSGLRVLFVGRSGGTSGHRREAFRRMGHIVTAIDPYGILCGNPLLHAWAFKTGGLALSGLVDRLICISAAGERFDIAWVESGELISASCVRRLRDYCNSVILFNLDNPFVSRDGRRWRLMLRALPEYDLFVTPRLTSVAAAYDFGARRAMQLDQGADEVVHRRIELSDADKALYLSEVAFVGTWFPERGPFLLELVRRGVPLKIFGPRWRKAKEYHKLQNYLCLDGSLNDNDYIKAISGSKIAICLASEANRDLHTTRTFEIPAIGALLCAGRTVDHLRLFREGEEAVFWSDPEECANMCLYLLRDEQRRGQIALAGHRRVVADGSFNQARIASVLNTLHIKNRSGKFICATVAS